jgi:hypothetical protein
MVRAKALLEERELVHVGRVFVGVWSPAGDGVVDGRRDGSR